MKVENYPKKMMIRHVHIADRPRERVIRQGADSLSNQELIAILLRPATRKESVLALANRLLKSVDKIQDLQHVTLEECMAVNGIGRARSEERRVGKECMLS